MVAFLSVAHSPFVGHLVFHLLLIGFTAPWLCDLEQVTYLVSEPSFGIYKVGIQSLAH